MKKLKEFQGEFRQFNKRLPPIGSRLHVKGSSNGPKTPRNLLIVVKTTRKNHDTRLRSILETWYQLAPQSVNSLQIQCRNKVLLCFFFFKKLCEFVQQTECEKVFVLLFENNISAYFRRTSIILRNIIDKHQLTIFNFFSVKQSKARSFVNFVLVLQMVHNLHCNSENIARMNDETTISMFKPSPLPHISNRNPG